MPTRGEIERRSRRRRRRRRDAWRALLRELEWRVGTFYERNGDGTVTVTSPRMTSIVNERDFDSLRRVPLGRDRARLVGTT